MYQSKKKIENKSLHVLRRELTMYLTDHDHIYARSLRRKVFLDKLPDVIIYRKKTRKKRLQCFVAACDILSHKGIICERYNDRKQKEFEIKGFSADGAVVTIHVREETSDRGDKKLYFISCFYAQK